MIFSFLKRSKHKDAKGRGRNGERPEVRVDGPESSSRPKRWGESGNVFFTLFGAVALVGVVGVATSTLMRGPVGTVVKLNQSAKADAQMQIAHKLAMLEASKLANSGDCDSDGYVEPIGPMSTAAAACVGPVPAGGGCLPNEIGSSKNDPWGTNYGYCAWDHGGVTGSTCSGSTYNANYLDPRIGENDSNQVVIAIISAGPDRQFQSTCADNPGYLTRAGDDLVLDITYAGAVQASGGLWSLKSGDPNTAAIDKDIEVAGEARFSSGGQFSGGTFGMQDSRLEFFGNNSLLLLPDEVASAACNLANQGALRRNTLGGTQEAIEVCDFVNGGGNDGDWVSVGGSGSTAGAQGPLGAVQLSDGNGGFSEDSPRLVYSSAGNGELTVPELNATGAVDFDATLNVDGAATVGSLNAGSGLITTTGNLNAGGTTTLAGTTVTTLNATSAVDFDTSLNVDGSTTLAGTTVSTLNATGAVDFDTTLNVDGALTVGGDITDSNGAVTFSDGDGVDITAGDLDVTNDIYANSFQGINGGVSPEGLFFDSANGLELRTEGNVALEIDSAGDVGIGIPGGPTARLDVGGEIRLRSVGNVAGANCNNLDGALTYTSGDELLVCSSVTGNWETIGTSGGGGGGAATPWDEFTDYIAYENSTFIVNEGSDISFASPALEGAGTRMIWYPSAGSFRAGAVSGSQWDEAQQGQYSTAFGLDTEASGDNSFAAGDAALATTQGAIALGTDVEARATQSIALGNEATVEAGATNSMAIGLGDASAGNAPQVRGANSLGIFMGDQDSLVFNSPNTVGIFGGEIIVSDGTQTIPSGSLLVDIEGQIGADQYCSEDGTFCFTPEEVASGQVGAPGNDSEIVFNSNGDLGTDPGFIFLRSVGYLGIGGGIPAANLHVTDGGNTTTALMDAADIAGSNVNLQLRAGQADLIARVTRDNFLGEIAGGAGDGLSLVLNASDQTDQLFLSSTGFIGMGTAVPGAQLELTEQMILGNVNDCTAATQGALRLNAGGDVLEMCDFAGSGGYVAIGGASVSAPGLDRQIIFNSGGSLDATSGFVFSSVGQLGIGTNAPNDELDVVGTAQITGATVLGDTLDVTGATTLNNTLTVTDQVTFNSGMDVAQNAIFSGDVGIGDATPDLALLLDVEGQIGADMYCDEDGINCFLPEDVAGNSVPGADTEVLFNSGGAMGTDPSFVFLSASNSLGLGNVTPNQWGAEASLSVGSAAVGEEGSVEIVGGRTANGPVGTLSFWNDGNVLGAIQASREGADDTGVLQFGATAGGTLGTQMMLTSAGMLAIGDGVNKDLLSLAGERAWTFGMSGAGATSALTLRPRTNDKSFNIVSEDQTQGVFSVSADNAVDASRVWLTPSGGRVGVDMATEPDVAFEVDGTIKIAYDGEACDADRQGAIHFDSAGEDFYVCQDGATWQRIITTGGGGGTPAGGNDREIQFNSGNSLTGEAGFVYTSAGRMGLGVASPEAKLHIFDHAPIVNIATAGVLNDQQSVLNFLTQSNGADTLGQATAKGWHMLARGDSWVDPTEQNDFGIAFWDGTAWSTPYVTIEHDTGNFGLGTATPSTLFYVSGSTTDGNFLATIENTGDDGEFLRMINDVGASAITFNQRTNGSAQMSMFDSIGTETVTLNASSGLIDLNGTASRFAFTDRDDFTDQNDEFRIDAGADVFNIRFYDDSASTAYNIMQFDAQGLVTFQSSGATVLNVGDTGERPTVAENGMIRYNTDTDKFEAYQGGSWEDIITSAVGGGAAAPDRGIQFRSGTGFAASDKFTYTVDGDFIVGSDQLDDTTTGLEDNRMFYDVSKGAFRAGRATSSQWDDGNVGDRSIGIGDGVIASSQGSLALGNFVFSQADNAIALGYDTQATGDYSLAIGLDNAIGSPLPNVSGQGSMGVFMGNQAGVNFASARTMGLFGGRFILDPNDTATNLYPSTGEELLEMDIEGEIGAIKYCDEDANDCFTASDVALLAGGSVPAPGLDTEIIFNSGGQFFASSGLIFDHADGTFAVSNNGSLTFTSSGSLYLGFDPDVTGPRLINSDIGAVFRRDVFAVAYDNNKADFDLARANGTESVPGVVVLDDVLGSVRFRGYNAAGAFEPAAAMGAITSGVVGNNVYADIFWSNDGSTTGETMRLTSAGRLGLGTSNPGSILTISGNNQDVQHYSYNGVNPTYGPDYEFYRDGGTEGASAAVGADDKLGGLRFHGYDGTGYERGAYITAYVDSGVTVANEDMPVHMSFATRSSTDNDTVERMRLTSDGNLGLGIQYASARLHVDGTIKIADGGETCTVTSDGGMVRWDGTVMQYCDGATWQDFASGATASPAAPSRGIQFNSGGQFFASSNFTYTTDGDFVVGSSQIDDTTTGNEDTRMYFDTSNGAFRAGTASGNQWDFTSAGNYSIGLGINATATNWNSIAIGDGAYSSGVSGVALGSSYVIGDYGTASGFGSSAEGERSVAMGSSAIAEGDRSVALGDDTASEGDYSLALGSNSRAEGDNSVTIGTSVEASGEDSMAMGRRVVAGNGTAGSGLGDGSFALGLLDNGVTVTTRPEVHGVQSFGIFMGDQDGGIVLSSANTMGLFGGRMVIDPSVPSTVLSAQTGLDVDAAIRIAWDSTEVCSGNAAMEGAIRYNSATDTFSFCANQGNDWESITLGSGTLDALSDTDLAGVLDGDVLTYNSTSGNWEPATVSTNFLGLTDTPGSYGGQAGRFARVNSGETAIEFTDELIETVTGEPSPTAMVINDLGDVSVGGAAGGQFLSYNSVSGDWVASSIPTGQGGKWEDGATAGEIFYSSGNVGIGTNDPANYLHISGTGSVGSFASIDVSQSYLHIEEGGSTHLYMDGNTIASTSDFGIGTTANADLRFYTDTDYAMSIDGGNGNVHIGDALASAVTMLQVDGAIKFASTALACNAVGHEGSMQFGSGGGNIFEVCADSGNGWEQLALGGTVAGAFTDLSDTPSGYGGQGGRFARVNSGETALEFTDEIIESVAGDAPVGIALNDLSDVVSSGATGGEILIYNNGTGNWEVGTAGSGGKWGDGVGVGEIFYNSGFVGVGTNDPDVLLHLHSDADEDVEMGFTNSASANGFWVGISSSPGGEAYFWNENNSGMEFATNNALRMFITDDGDIGIGGMYDPDTKLEIDGTIKIGFGGEACDAAREGAIYYDSALDKFYGCQTAGSWTELGAGAGGGGGSGLWEDSGSGYIQYANALGGAKLGTTSGGATPASNFVDLLNDLSNVNTGTPDDNSVLRYDSASGEWVASTTGGGKWLDGATAGEIFYNSGYVGIGTNDPEKTLDIRANASGENVARFQNEDPGGWSTFDIHDDTGTLALGIGIGNSSQAGFWNNQPFISYSSGLAFITGASQQMRIGNGRLGVGDFSATDPVARLDVAGAIKFASTSLACNDISHEGSMQFGSGGSNIFEVCADNANGWEQLALGGTVGGDFTDLGDTPSSYGGQGGRFARVNSGETAIEFTDELFESVTGQPVPSAMVLDNLGDVSTAGAADGSVIVYNSASGWVIGAAGEADTLSGLSCSADEVAQWNGSAWVCSSSAGGLWEDSGSGYIQYTSTLGGVKIASVTGASAPAGAIGAAGGGSDTLASLSCSSGEVAQWNGSSWICSASAGGNWLLNGSDVYYSSGSVGVGTSTPGSELEVVGTVQADMLLLDAVSGDAPTGISLDGLSDVTTSGAADGSVIVYNSASGWVIGAAGEADTLSGLSCSVNEVAQWNGSAWVCSASAGGLWEDSGSGYIEYASSLGGIQVAAITGTAAPSGAVSSGSGGADTLSSLSCSADEVAQWNGAAWVCSNSAGGLWSDSGSGYIEYTSSLGGMRVASVAGAAQPPSGAIGGDDLGDHTAIQDLNMAGSDIVNAVDITYSGSLTDTSDRRLKTDIKPLDTQTVVGKLTSIDTYSFRMKDNPQAGVEFGVMAQELKEVFPELVKTADDEMGTMSVNYIGLVAPLIEASKELKAENDTLKAELAEMKMAQADILQEVRGLKAHTGYGISKAEIGLWVIAGMFGMGGLFFMVGGIMRNRQRRSN